MHKGYFVGHIANMNIFTSKNRLITVLKFPIAILSLYLLAIGLVALLLPSVSIDVNAVTSLLWSTACAGIIASFAQKDSLITVCTALSLLLVNAVFYVISGEALGIMVSLLLSLLAVRLCREMTLEYYVICSALAGVIIGVVLGLLYSPFCNLVRSFAYLIKGRAVLFGIVNEVYNLFFGDYLCHLVYTTDCSTSLIVDKRLVSGAVDLFLTNPKNPPSVVSQYLTGKYFVNIFLPIGLYASLFGKIKKHYLFSLSLSTLLSVLLGNNVMLLMFLFFYNPLMLVGYLFAVGVCYLVPALMDIRIGFTDYASVVSLVKYGNSFLWVLLIGAVLAVTVYFVVQMVLARFDMDNQKYYPRELKALVKALGGERNIVSLDGEVLTVRNPNLIDIIKVDCDIHQDKVTLIEKDYEILKDYF